jgi:hypothetical protein
MDPKSTLLMLSQDAMTTARWLTDRDALHQQVYAFNLISNATTLLGLSDRRHGFANSEGIDSQDYKWIIRSKENALWCINYIKAITGVDHLYRFYDDLPLFPDAEASYFDVEVIRAEYAKQITRADYHKNRPPWWMPSRAAIGTGPTQTSIGADAPAAQAEPEGDDWLLTAAYKPV